MQTIFRTLFATLVVLQAFPLDAFNGCCSLNGNVLGHVDFLYWKPCSDGAFVALDSHLGLEFTPATEYLYDIGDVRFLATTDADEKFRPKEIDFETEAGVAFGFTFHPCERCWDLGLHWTYYSPKSGNQYRYDNAHFLIPFGTRNGAVTPIYTGIHSGDLFYLGLPLNHPNTFRTLNSFTRIKGSWDLDLHLVDLELGYTLCPSECFSVHPHIDLRFASIDQNLVIRAEGDLLLAANTRGGEPGDLLGSVKSKERFVHNFEGFGPRMGLSTELTVWCGLGLYGDVAVSTLYGHQISRDTLKQTSDVNDNPYEIESIDFTTKTKKSKDCIRTIADLGFGLFWDVPFCCDRSLSFLLLL